MDRVRVGFIGAGRISTLHALAYEDNPTGKLVAVADADRTVAESQAARWGTPRVYTDYRDLLADPEVDAVEILLPHHLHRPVTLEALAAGKHVSLQKPMCLDMDEARQLAEAVGKADVTFRVEENYRTYEPYMRAKAMLDEGEIGEPLGIRVKTVHGQGRGGWDIPDSAMLWRVDPSQRGTGSAIVDYGAHITSIVPYFMGRVEKVHAMVGESEGLVNLAGVPAAITWKHEGGNRFGTWDMVESQDFVIDTKHYPVDEWVEVTGTRGIIWVTRCTARMVDLPPVIMFRDGNTTHFSDMETDWGDSFRRVGHEFTSAIVDGTQPQLDIEEATHMQAFSTAIVQSAAEHLEVALRELS